jgi:hypothetical protein
MKFTRGTYAAVTAATLVVAAGAGVYFANSPTKSFAWRPDVLSVMHSRSPGERAEGALLVKKGMAKLAEAAPAAMPKAPVVAAPAVPAATAPIVAAAPLPAVIPAVAPAAAPLAAIPAVAHASSFIIPPVIIPGSHTHTRVVTPPTPPSPPPPVPGVPEPQTWIMMIVGFGFLGMFLRRRNRSIERQPVQLPETAAATLQRS